MIQDLFFDITEALQSHAMAMGRFDKVNGAEPKGPPGNGLTAAIWVQSFYPRQAPHGLATSSMILIMTLRVYTDMLQEPVDMIDPTMMEAVGEFITRVSADFTLDGMTGVMAVDLTGMHGNGLGGQAGYVEINKKLFRIFTVDVPIVLADVFTQTA
jgi:hypothetical protein